MQIQRLAPEDKQALLDLADGIPNRIKLSIENAGLTYADIAREMDVKERTVYEWSRSGQISKERVPLLCTLLDISVQYLMTGNTEEPFQQRTPDAQVVQFERPVQREIHDAEVMSKLITRFVPIYEISELVASIENSPDDFVNHLPTWLDRPEKRGSIAVTISPDYLGLPGIPRFCFQMVVDYVHGLSIGDYVAYAPDLIPDHGRFALFAHRKRNTRERWKLATGFFTLDGGRQVSANMSENFFKTTNFIVKTHPDETRSNDIHITPDEEWMFLGTATYLSRWLDPVQMSAQTSLSNRLEAIYMTRRNHKLDVNSYGC